MSVSADDEWRITGIDADRVRFGESDGFAVPFVLSAPPPAPWVDAFEEAHGRALSRLNRPAEVDRAEIWVEIRPHDDLQRVADWLKGIVEETNGVSRRVADMQARARAVLKGRPEAPWDRLDEVRRRARQVRI